MDAAGHKFTLCVKGTDGWGEKAPIAPKGAVFLPNISIASEGIQYLTLLHHNMKQVAIFLAAKGGYSPPPLSLIHIRPVPTSTKDLFFPLQITLPAEELQ